MEQLLSGPIVNTTLN